MSSVIFSLNKLRVISSLLKDVSDGSANEAARIAEEYAVSHVQVLTGKTRQSIHIETDGKTVSLIAGEASPFLEFGTVHMRAFPFLRPAMEEAESRVDSEHLKIVFEGGL